MRTPISLLCEDLFHINNSYSAILNIFLFDMKSNTFFVSSLLTIFAAHVNFSSQSKQGEPITHTHTPSLSHKIQTESVKAMIPLTTIRQNTYTHVDVCALFQRICDSLSFRSLSLGCRLSVFDERHSIMNLMCGTSGLLLLPYNVCCLDGWVGVGVCVLSCVQEFILEKLKAKVKGRKMW